MNTELKRRLTDDVEMDNAMAHRHDTLEMARQLDQLAKRFERFMTMQLEQLEFAIDDFQRERDAWRRQRDREYDQQQHEVIDQEVAKVGHFATSGEVLERVELGIPSHSPVDPPAGSVTAPLRMLIWPNEATAMQIGLLFFEISKFNRELGGSGVRFDVSSSRLPNSSDNGESGRTEAILALEAFSYAPLLTYDGAQTRQFQTWDRFKSEMLMSSMIEPKLYKQYQRFKKAPHQHHSLQLAEEATRRAENANSRCDVGSDRSGSGIYNQQDIDHAATQQLNRIEEVAAYLRKECGMRMHVSLTW